MNMKFIAALLTSTVLGHMKMQNPPPRKGANNPSYPYGVDYDLVAPLGAGKPFPCGGAPAGPSVLTVKAGSSISVDITGGATHNGGHCQFAISYDGCSTWVVLKTVMNDCLVGSGLHFDVPVPQGAPSSNKAVFSWNWINKTGNREFYMNCADITVDGVDGGSITGPELLVADLPGYPTIPEFTNGGNNGQDLFDARKTITVTSNGSTAGSSNAPAGNQTGGSPSGGSSSQSSNQNSGSYTTISPSSNASNGVSQSNQYGPGNPQTSSSGGYQQTSGANSGGYATAAQPPVAPTTIAGYPTSAAVGPGTGANPGVPTTQNYNTAVATKNALPNANYLVAAPDYPTPITSAQTTSSYPSSIPDAENCDTDDDIPIAAPTTTLATTTIPGYLVATVGTITQANPVAPSVPAAPAYPVTTSCTTTQTNPAVTAVPTTQAYPVTPSIPTTQANPVVTTVTTTQAYPVTTSCTTTQANPAVTTVPTTQAYPVAPSIPTTQANPVVTTVSTTQAYPVAPAVPTTPAYPVATSDPASAGYPVIAPTMTTAADSGYPTQNAGYD